MVYRFCMYRAVYWRQSSKTTLQKDTRVRYINEWIATKQVTKTPIIIWTPNVEANII